MPSVHRFSAGRAAFAAVALVVVALSGSVAPAVAADAGSYGVTGRPLTSGPNYDRNASVVQDGRATYVFFARSQVAPCNRLNHCDPDQRKYDLYYKKSTDGGRSYGAAQLAAVNPDPTPDTNPAAPYGGFRGRTIAAVKASNKITVFWADGGNVQGLYKVEKAASADTFSPPTVVPVAELVFNVDAITRGNQTFVYTEGDGANGYGVYAHPYAAGAAGPGTLVMADRNIPKAIVDHRGIVRLTYVDATQYPTVDVYVTSSLDGIHFAAERLAVAAAPGESNWDPNLVEQDGTFFLFFAPDRQAGMGKQQLALATSRDFNTWTRRGDITPGSKDGVEYWDYWPEPTSDGNSLSLLYTSERGTGVDPTGIGHIWIIDRSRGGDGGDGHGGDGHGHSDWGD